MYSESWGTDEFIVTVGQGENVGRLTPILYYAILLYTILCYTTLYYAILYTIVMSTVCKSCRSHDQCGMHGIRINSVTKLSRQNDLYQIA